MEPFHHLPPFPTAHGPPTPHPAPKAHNLQAVTNEWLALTMDPNGQSLASTPVPPTPPPLPPDLTPFIRPQRSTAPSPAPSYRDFTSPTPALSRTQPPITHFTVLSPPPTPHSQFTHTHPVSDTTLGYNSRDLNIIQKQPKSPTKEVLSSTKPQSVKSPGPVPHKDIVQENTRQDPPHVKPQVKDPFQIKLEVKDPYEVKLEVKDPYDDLLSMILSGSSSTEEVHDLRLSPEYHPPSSQKSTTQSGLKFKTEESPQPKEEARCGRGLSGRICLDLHSPVTVKPLSVLWEEQSEPADKSPVGKGLTELFIEEEEDKEEELRVLNERLSPQVEHGVMHAFSSKYRSFWKAHRGKHLLS